MQEIIGQFGVGFYSAFMVADKIEVYSKSSVTPGPGYLWTSDGSGKYTMQEVEGLEPGTKIVLLTPNLGRAVDIVGFKDA